MEFTFQFIQNVVWNYRQLKILRETFRSERDGCLDIEYGRAIFDL